MRAERIQTEIMIEVAPDSMDVIRIVLCIVVLDHECRPLDAIVVRLAGLTAAGPCEVDVLEPRSSQFRELLVSEFLPQAARIPRSGRSTFSLVLASSHAKGRRPALPAEPSGKRP